MQMRINLRIRYNLTKYLFHNTMYYLMAYLHYQTQTWISVQAWISIPNMGAVVMGDQNPDREMYRVPALTPVQCEFLPPAKKLGQGNIFSSVCQELCPRGGGSIWAGTPPGQVHPPWSMSGRYSSYWNAFLLVRCLQGTSRWKRCIAPVIIIPNWHFYDYYSHLVCRLRSMSVYPVHNSANLLRQVQVHIRSFNRSILKITVTAVFEAGDDTHLALQMFLVQTHLVSWWTRLHIVFGWSVNFAF